jgi:hypothetical protein
VRRGFFCREQMEIIADWKAYKAAAFAQRGGWGSGAWRPPLDGRPG